METRTQTRHPRNTPSKKPLSAWIVGLVALLLSSVSHARNATPGVDLGSCHAKLNALIGGQNPFRSLNFEQTLFLKDVFLPAAGLRSLYQEKDQIQDWNVGAHHLELSGLPDSKRLRIEWVDYRFGPKPWTESIEDTFTIKIPYGTNFSKMDNHGANWMKQALVGSPLHPYYATESIKQARRSLEEPELFLKRVQSEAIQTALSALERGDRSFLFVAPTGTGKTEVLTGVLDHQIENSPQRLHVLVADSNSLVKQLEKDVLHLQEAKQKVLGLPPISEGGEPPFVVIRWGDGNPASLKKLLSTVAKGKPVVLVTTIQSLKSKLGTDPKSKNLAAVKKVLGTLVYDEAHHTGAKQAKQLIENLMLSTPSEPSHVKLIGTTATPAHAEESIQNIFENKAYWAYIDNKDGYLLRGGSYERAESEVFAQYANAIEAGELTALYRSGTHFLNPKAIVREGSLFKKTKNRGSATRYTIDEKHMDRLVGAISPLLSRHHKGFITVSTTDEAKRLTERLNALVPGRTFKEMHSKLDDPESVLNEFKGPDGPNFLVTVKMLDEGVNHPEMSLFIDLNRNIAPKQFLQRLGRVLRIFPKKETAEILTVMDIAENERDDRKALLKYLLEGGLEGSVERRQPLRPPSNFLTQPDTELPIVNGFQHATLVWETFQSWSPRKSRLTESQMRESYLEFYQKYTGRPHEEDEGYGPVPPLDPTYPETRELRLQLSSYLRRGDEFVDKFPKGPRLRLKRLLFEKRVTKKVKQSPKLAAQVISDYVQTFGILPTKKIADQKVYGLMDLLKWDPFFERSLSPEAAALFDAWLRPRSR